MIGFIIKNECLELIKDIKKSSENYLFRPHELFKDFINGNDTAERKITKIISEHDKKFSNSEIDNLYYNYIEDVHWTKRESNMYFLIDENNKIFGEARFGKILKFKLYTIDEWICNFCKKGDDTKIENVVELNAMCGMQQWNFWLQKLGRSDLQDCWKKTFHRCSNCKEKIHDYYVADEKLVEFFKKTKEKNYWVYSIDYITFYENWKDFNFRKVNVLIYEKNK